MFNRSRFRQRFDGATVAGLTEGTLVAPYVFAAPLTLSRAQTGGVQSSALAADGSSVVFYGADTPRFNGSTQRLLSEGQRTNRVMQPIAVASATGAWVQSGGTATPSITRNYSTAPDGTQTAARVRWVGPITGSVALRVPLSGADVSASHVVSFYAFTRSLGGATSVNVDVMDGSEQNLVAQFTVNQWVRVVSPVVTAGTNAGSQWADFVFAGFTTGEIDFDLWGAQVEEASFTSSPIIPPSATPGASTRGVDLISATLANLGVTSGITMLWSGLIYQSLATAGEQTILHVSDGTSNNRYRLINESGSGNILLLRATAGVGGPNIITPGSPRPTNSIFKLGLSIDISTGTAISSLNGGAVGTITGGPTSGLTLFNLGSANSFAPMFGETARLRILPYSVPDATLQSLVSALP